VTLDEATLLSLTGGFLGLVLAVISMKACASPRR
jgi:hypothetical protein